MAQQPTRYPAPASIVQVEEVIKRSRFIGTAGPAATVDEAQAFIAEVRDQYRDATHNAWAFLVGIGDSAVRGMSDDGEPSGTAGQPILARIEGSGLGDLVVVVTRYFGGVKLGTGGLVRAYGGVAGMAIKALDIVEKVRMKRIDLEAVHYSHYGPLRGLIEAHGGKVIEENFGEAVDLRVAIPLDRLTPFANAVRDATAGAIQVNTNFP
ncbi:MAG: YigZ family protein [Chloroflexi bacterium]|nr:MAG: YigZ family protein [Chloroflexota bacterium]